MRLFILFMVNTVISVYEKNLLFLAYSLLNLVINLHANEAQNPKLTSERGALLALLEHIAIDRENKKELSSTGSDTILKALIDNIPHEGISRKRRFSFGEIYKKAATEKVNSKNPEYYPKYIECPEFIHTPGIILTKELFNLFARSNKLLYSELESLKLSKSVLNIESISNAILESSLPNSVIEAVQNGLDSLITSTINENSSYLISLLNEDKIHSELVKSPENIGNAVKKIWMVYFQNIDQAKFQVFPLEYLSPIVCIQVIPSHDENQIVTGVFRRLRTGDDPRTFLIQFGNSDISEIISNCTGTKTYNQIVIERNYDYSKYSIVHEQINEKNSKLSKHVLIHIARLCATLEKMLGLELKIFFQTQNSNVKIIQIENVYTDEMTKWEIKNEFESAEMNFDLKEATKEFTPLTISSIISLMSQSQQYIFYGVSTEQLFAIGKFMQKFKFRTSSSKTIHRLLSLTGEAALQHIGLNLFNYRYDLKLIPDFISTVETALKGQTNGKKLFEAIEITLKDSHVMWNCYYNLIALQRSWIYAIFKFICGTSDEMKADHYEDFAMILQYFNLKDLATQNLVQECKRVGDEFLDGHIDQLEDEEVADIFNKVIDLNSTLHKPKAFELLFDDNDANTWKAQCRFAFTSYAKIKSSNLNSTFSMKFPEERNHIDHVLKHLCSVRTQFDITLMKIMLLQLRKITRKLLQVNLLREYFVELMKDAFKALAELSNTQNIYFMTQRELQLFIKKQRYEFFERAKKRHAIFSDKIVSSQETHIDKINSKAVCIHGDCVNPGIAVGFATVLTVPTEDLIQKDSKSKILVTRNLRKNISWLPFLRLFDGIILEVDGYLDSDAAICRLVGVPCIIGAKDATKFIKTGDKIILNATKGQLIKE